MSLEWRLSQTQFVWLIWLNEGANWDMVSLNKVWV